MLGMFTKHKKLLLIMAVILLVIGVITFLYTNISVQKPLPEEIAPDERFCGGIMGRQCPEGYTCQLDGDYPDAGGVCIFPPAKPV